MASLPKQDRDPPPPCAGMRERIAAFDWATTPLGPMASWSGVWRFALDLCLASPVPSALYLGPDLRLLYNDPWAPVIGDRHPAMLGRTASEVWRDLWDQVGPHFAQVQASGEGVSIEAEPLALAGGEERWWSYSLTPLHAAAGASFGILIQGNDVSKTVHAERRLSFQVQVADRLRGLTDPEEVKAAATALLGEYLRAARVGYAEVDEAADLISVRGDWTRDGSVPSLAGETGPYSNFGAEALAFLRTGQVLVIDDVEAFPSNDPQRRQSWQELGLRALITVPLVRDGEVKALLYVHEPVARRWTRAEAAMARDLAERTWAAVERAQAEQSLRISEDHYRHTVELNPQVTWTALPDGRINRIAPRWDEWTGTSAMAGGWREAMHPDDHAFTLDSWVRCLETGQPYDVEHRVRRRDGRYRWARTRAWPRRDGEGSITLWYGSTEDIDERKAAEERQRLLINELNHRVKNTLATVQAIAFQTLRGDVPLADARALFEARLLALSRAHNLLTEQNWGGAALQTVVADATEPLGGGEGRFRLSGEPLWLTPRAALALALALHELGTNAAKYGALSVDGGEVAIAWRIEGERLLIEWKERGGPLVAAPERRGFGSRLIERGLGSDLEGTAHLLFEPDGLRCTIDARLAAVAAEEPPRG
jgi:PAS domain S-box-containing protein